MIKTMFHKIVKRNSSKHVNFSLIKNSSIQSENVVDKTLYKFYFNHYKKDNEDLTDEVIESYININDSTLLLNNKNLHLEFIKELNKSFNKEIITNFEYLEEHYSLQDFKNLELAFHSKTKSELPEELRENRIELKEKYELCKKEMFLPLIRKSDNKKILAVMRPTKEMIKIRHKDMVFTTGDIISHYYMIKGLSFLENHTETMDEINPNELLNQILQFMIDKGYNDLQMLLFDSQYYAITAKKNTINKTIASRISFMTSKKITEAVLRKIEEDVKTIKSDISKKLTYQTALGSRFFRIQLLAQSKTAMNSLYIHRTLNLRLLGDSSLIKDFKKLGFGDVVEDLIKSSITSSTSGFYFITGETNSGKTTTLYAILYYLYVYLKETEGKEKKIMTIDNPLEYDIDGFISVDLQDTKGTQRELTIDEIISAILRSDPDFVVFTEMRKKDEFEGFCRVGLRGHPAFATFHANSVIESIQFLEDNVETNKLQIRRNMKLAMNNNLVAKKCSCCGGKGFIDEKTQCIQCEDGVSGMLPIFELVYFNQKGEKEHGFDPKYDDINDLEKLHKEGKIIWIKKSEVAEKLYKEDLIFEQDYLKYSGKKSKMILENYNKGSL